MVSLRVERWYDYPRVCGWLVFLVPFYLLFCGYVWLIDEVRHLREAAKGLAIQGAALVICAGMLGALVVVVVLGKVHNLRHRRQALRGRSPLGNAASGESSALVSGHVAV
jgi:hypothetical protein